MATTINAWEGQLTRLSPPRWVQLSSASTQNFISQTPSDPQNGSFVILSVPSGVTYSLSTGPTPNGPWTVEDSNYSVGFFASNPASGNLTSWGSKTGRYNVKDAANPNGAAKGDGVTDDTSSLAGPAAALTVTFVGGDFEYTGGGTAEVGPGTYATSANLQLKAGMAYQGAGWGATIIDATLSAGIDAISADGGGIKRSAIRDLTIRLNTGRDAIRMDKVWQCDFERLRLLGKAGATGNGLTIMSSSAFGSYVNYLNRIRANGFTAGAGISIDGFNATWLSTGTVIHNAWCDGCQEGIHLGQFTATMTLIDCEPQANSLNGVYIAGGIIQIIGGSIETNTARGIDITSTAGSLTLLGVNFSGNGQNIRNNSADANMNFFACLPRTLDQITVGGPAVIDGQITAGADIVGSFGFAIRQNTGSILLDTGASGNVAFRTNNGAAGGQVAILDSTGKFSKYNNGITAGTGVPLIWAEYASTGLTAAVTNAINSATPAAAGTYRLMVHYRPTATGASTSVGVTVTYKDSTGAITLTTLPFVRRSTAALAAPPFLNTGADDFYVDFPFEIDNSATAITVSTTGTFTGTTYNLAISLEQVK